MLVILTLIPEKGREQIILGNISKHMKDEKVTGSRQIYEGKMIFTQTDSLLWQDG